MANSFDSHWNNFVLDEKENANFVDSNMIYTGLYTFSMFLEVVVQTTTYIQFAFVVLHSRGGSWELVDAFSLCCLTWHFWKILGE